jgi:CHAT domain-containing protein
VSDQYFKNGDVNTAADINAHLLSLDPSLMAGVALAGANGGRTYHPAEPMNGLNDGILTGMESAGLDMEGVDLVVLSGCDTVGVAAAGQSLFGLVNAFRVAGAKAVVASLFRVKDVETARLMEEFYRVMLTNRVGPAIGLRRAALNLKKTGAPASVWAAFVSYCDLKSAPFLLKER